MVALEKPSMILPVVEGRQDSGTREGLILFMVDGGEHGWRDLYRESSLTLWWRSLLAKGKLVCHEAW